MNFSIKKRYKNHQLKKSYGVISGGAARFWTFSKGKAEFSKTRVVEGYIEIPTVGYSKHEPLKMGEI
jgi:hypothetical protein